MNEANPSVGSAYFSTPERRMTLEQEAWRWVGTPFVPHASVCGSGVDCVNLNAAIYIRCGHLPFFSAPHYTLDGGRHQAGSQLIGWIESHPWWFEKVENKKPMPGDTLCFRQGRSSHHAALMVTEAKFIHAMERYGVVIGKMEGCYPLALSSVFRPIKL
jgi:cell wall-associated NlpC family hydrolase